jgi:hypothetical protein
VRKVTLPHVAGMPVHLHFASASPAATDCGASPPQAAEGALAELAARGRPVAVAFLLHGRLGESEALDGTAAALVRRCSPLQHKPLRDLVVVTLDHRNHGHRRVRDLAKHVSLTSSPSLPRDSQLMIVTPVCVCSESWRAGNETHAQDMFSIQYGTAQDVSLLVSLLPAYLPAALRVELWACVGVSLGGHSTWLALLHDPRIAVGVPIIGCCDYLSLMRNRLRGSDEAINEETEAERKYLPDGLKSALRLLDAGGMGEPAVQRLKTRKLLVLCGSDDRLVPYHCSQPFIERLQRAMADELEAAADHLHHQSGVCEVVVETGKGHELTDSMVTAAGDWLLRWACSAAAAGHDSRL